MKCAAILLLVAVMVGYSEGCSCLQTHPQEHFCAADFVLQVRIRSLRKGGFKKELVPSSMIKYYSVRISKIYKLVENKFGINENTTVVKIVTPAYDSLCGVELQKNVKYVITGKFQEDGQMHIDICNSWIIPLPHVTRKMRKNLRFLYHRNCGCKVQLDDAQVQETQNMCIWKYARPDADCYSRYSACVTDINSTTNRCKWHRNRHLKKCRADAKRGPWEP